MGASRQSSEEIELHHAPMDAVDLALQAYLEKLRTGFRVIIDLENRSLHYHSIGRGERLGPLEKRILLTLSNGPLIGAEIARKLHIWHQDVYEALKHLRRKGLVESWTAIGENLPGTRILRRFYALNPGKVAVAVPAASPTRIQLQQAKEKAQSLGIRRERKGVRLRRTLSPKPATRLKALIDRSHSPRK